jgi:ABC-2 type transport system permease protein
MTREAVMSREDTLAVPGAPDAVTRSVLSKTLWENRRAVIGWALSVAAVGAMYAAFWPMMDTPDMQQAMNSFPPELLEAMNYNDLTSATGYIGSAVFGMLAAVLTCVMTIMQGSRALAGDEEDGVLDLLLAHPVTRARLALERFGALAVSVVLAAATLWLAVVALRGPARLDGISVGELAAASTQLALFGLVIGGVTFAVGAATGRRGTAVSVGAAVTVLGYLANGVFPQFEPLRWTRNVSPWDWYVGGSPLRNGLQLADCGLMLAVTVVLVGVGTWVFTRRDIGV